MQQQMMKYMMVFIGVLFFKVPAGLCIYFISSSLWGIAERLMLPKVIPPSGAAPESKLPPKAVKAGRSDPPPKGRPARRLKKR